MHITRLAVLLALASTLALCGPAGATLCLTKKSRLAVRDECRRKEKTVDPANTPFKGEKGDPGDKGAPGTIPGTGPELRIVDSKGQDVGMVVTADVGGAALVLRQIGPDSVVFTVNESGFVADDPYLLPFGSADCAGTRYVLQRYQYSSSDNSPDPDVALAQRLFVDSARTAGYLAGKEDGFSPPATLYVRRRVDGATAGAAVGSCTGAFGGTVVGSPAACDFNPSRVCISCCQSASATGVVLRPVNAVDLGSLGLTPPFAYRR